MHLTFGINFENHFDGEKKWVGPAQPDFCEKIEP